VIRRNLQMKQAKKKNNVIKVEVYRLIIN